MDDRVSDSENIEGVSTEGEDTTNRQSWTRTLSILNQKTYRLKKEIYWLKGTKEDIYMNVKATIYKNALIINLVILFGLLLCLWVNRSLFSTERMDKFIIFENGKIDTKVESVAFVLDEIRQGHGNRHVTVIC